MKHCGIYQIKNEVTGKIYIGQSNDINRRWSEHKSRAFDPNNNCYHKPLYLSMRKYGLEAFTLTILEECLLEKLRLRAKLEDRSISAIIRLAIKKYLEEE